MCIRDRSKILSSLTEKLDTTIVLLKITVSTLTSGELVSFLKIHEERVHKRSESTSERAFRSNHKNKFTKNGRKYGGKRDSESNSSKELEKQNPRFDKGEKKGKYPPYGICKRTNHLD